MGKKKKSKVNKAPKKKAVKKEQKNRILVALWIAAGLVVLLCGVYLSTLLRGATAKYEECSTKNKFVSETPQVVLTRNSKEDGPADTLLSLEKAAEGKAGNTAAYFSLQLTKDGTLILLSSDTLDDVSNAADAFNEKNIKAKDHDIWELYHLNFGEKYIAVDGSTPYAGLRGKDLPDNLGPTTLEEALDYALSEGMDSFVINIKDTGMQGAKTVDALAKVLEKYEIKDRTLLLSFDEGMLKYLDAEYAELHHNASAREVMHLYVDYLLGREAGTEDYAFDVLVTTPVCKGLRMNTQGFVNYVHKGGLAIYYYADKNIAYLANLHADAVITNYKSAAEEILK